MPHQLAKRHELHPLRNPLTVSLRYRCECATNEVLTIQLVLDKDVSEEMFVYAMRQMFHDMKLEVEQHLVNK